MLVSKTSTSNAMNDTPLKNEFLMDVQTFKKGAMVFRAVNHQLRQDILRLIHTKGEMTVTQIYTKLRLEQSVASQHLAILRKAAFVNTRRDGKQIIYSVNYDRLRQLHQTALSLLDTTKYL